MGTIQKMAGKFKGLFTKQERVKPVIEHQRSEVSLPKVKESPSKPMVKRRNLKQGHFNKPSWWKRFYNKKTRAEVGLLNLHMVKHQGSFKPVRPFNYIKGSATPMDSGRIGGF